MKDTEMMPYLLVIFVALLLIVSFSVGMLFYKPEPEKINYSDMRGAAKFQALKELSK